MGTIKIIECFDISGRGLITEIQHFENGIKPGAVVIDPKTSNSWSVEKRILSGNLLLVDAEVFFECETEFEHFSMTFKDVKTRKEATEKERNKRKQGIYWYLLKGVNTKEKPEIGCVLNFNVGV